LPVISAGNHPGHIPAARFGVRKGFTLIEVMISIALIGTLSAIAIPSFIGYREKANNMKALDELHAIETSIIYFYTKTFRYPDSLAEVSPVIPLDPWGIPYQYARINGGVKDGHFRKDKFFKPVNTDFDLYSMVKDKVTNASFDDKKSLDDVVRAENGQFYGLAGDH
jgi:general secretion pathway protein G